MESIFKELKKLDESVSKLSSGVELFHSDSDTFIGRDLVEIIEYIQLDKPGIDRTLFAKVVSDFDADDIEWVWEPDGNPTYVDYGSQSVLYDDGKGGVYSVKIPDLHFDIEFEDEDYRVLSDDEVKEVFGIDDKQLEELKDGIINMMNDSIIPDLEDDLVEDSDYWPEPDDFDW